MLGLDFFKRVPPSVTAYFFYYVLPALLLIRFFIGTIWGVFLLAVAAYLGLCFFGESKPLTISQIALFIDALSTESKTSIFTSILTIVGFLVAFHTATLNWKAEALAQLKVHVAGEIESFFSEASRLTMDAQIYVRSLVEAVNTVQTEGATPHALFKIEYALKHLAKFIATRDRLSAMSVQVHAISGRHALMLSTISGATKMLEECAGALCEITTGMWIRLPYIKDDHPNPLSEFIMQINVAECSAFVACCDRNQTVMSGVSGAIRGYLLAPLVGVNFSSVHSLRGKRAMLENVFTKIREGGKPRG